MKILVKAKPNAKESKVVPPPTTLFASRDGAEECYVVYVQEPPVEGRANEAIIRLLAEHFHVSRSEVRLLRGAMGKKKIFEITS